MFHVHACILHIFVEMLCDEGLTCDENMCKKSCTDHGQCFYGQKCVQNLCENLCNTGLCWNEVLSACDYFVPLSALPNQPHWSMIPNAVALVLKLCCAGC